MSRRRLLILISAVVGTVATVLPPAGSAPSPERIKQRVWDKLAVLGRDYTDLGDGHFRVRLRDGTLIYTHGPDFVENHGSSLGTGDPERPPACATDYYQHVLYGRPSAAVDRYATVKSQIQTAMRRINAVLNEESLESGSVTADYKVLCDAQGQIVVGQFTNSATSSFGDVISAAKSAGFNKSNADYTIFYDAGGPAGTCGTGSLYRDERLTSSNYNNNGGSYGVSYSGCWNSTPMHENGHNQGAVQYYAPNGTGSGLHCQDENDVMCYADGGSRFTGIVQRCTDKLHFDCGNDDYFDSSPEPGEYLASHWNLGSPLNRFIKFGSASATPTVTSSPTPSPTSTPTPSPTATQTPTPTPTPAPTDPTTLTNGVARSATSGTRYSWSYFRISVPSGKTRLTVELDGPACWTTTCNPNLNLYTRRTNKPTLSYYSCAARTADSDETCVKSYPYSGYWYIGVYVSVGSSVPYTIKATHS